MLDLNSLKYNMQITLQESQCLWSAQHRFFAQFTILSKDYDDKQRWILVNDVDEAWRIWCNKQLKTAGLGNNSTIASIHSIGLLDIQVIW